MGELGTFIVNNGLLFAAFFALLLMLIGSEVKRKFLGFKEIATKDAIQLINKEDAVVIDVRSEDDFAAGHIINAHHAPVGVIEARIHDITSDKKDQPVLIYCDDGRLSAKAGQILHLQGWSRVYKLKGGLMSWTGDNYPLES